MILNTKNENFWGSWSKRSLADVSFFVLFLMHCQAVQTGQSLYGVVNPFLRIKENAN